MLKKNLKVTRFYTFLGDWAGFVVEKKCQNYFFGLAFGGVFTLFLVNLLIEMAFSENREFDEKSAKTTDFLYIFFRKFFLGGF